MGRAAVHVALLWNLGRKVRLNVIVFLYIFLLIKTIIVTFHRSVESWPYESQTLVLATCMNDCHRYYWFFPKSELLKRKSSKIFPAFEKSSSPWCIRLEPGEQSTTRCSHFIEDLLYGCWFMGIWSTEMHFYYQYEQWASLLWLLAKNRNLWGWRHPQYLLHFKSSQKPLFAITVSSATFNKSKAESPNIQTQRTNCFSECDLHYHRV